MPPSMPPVYLTVLDFDPLELARQIRKIGGVEAVDIITGDADLLVTVRCRDIEDFQKVLLGKLQAIEGITETRSLIVIAEE